jgi:hypothetical protein
MCTARAEQFLVASLAVRYPILLVKVARAEGHVAVPTHEVLRVVGVVECLDYLTKDGLTAVRAVSTRRGTAAVEVTRGGLVDVREQNV